MVNLWFSDVQMLGVYQSSRNPRHREFDSLFHYGIMAAAKRAGSVAEWFKATVLKTVDGQLS
ncbi:protein of unknown function [Pseudomonas sp. JV551A1]|uniref:Uncharacterized protein n=1 Tax=Pseudomonas inefficax TaxID=2078786 RepID=A0AAQ1PAQ2_9PSED|nr:protein of unknown function [Pseudomonas sp. JV551A1]SPO62376.1 protein of unknown function [Pseudomonas inefficax]